MESNNKRMAYYPTQDEDKSWIVLGQQSGEPPIVAHEGSFKTKKEAEEVAKKLRKGNTKDAMTATKREDLEWKKLTYENGGKISKSDLNKEGTEWDVTNSQHETLPNRTIRYNPTADRYEMFNYTNNEVDYSYRELEDLIRNVNNILGEKFVVVHADGGEMKPENVDLGEGFELIFNEDHSVDVEYKGNGRSLLVSYSRFENDGFSYEDDAPDVPDSVYEEVEEHEEAIQVWEDVDSYAEGGEIKKGDKVKVVADYGSGINSVSKGQRGEVESIDKSDNKTVHVIGSSGKQFWTPLSNLEVISSYAEGGGVVKDEAVNYDESVLDFSSRINIDKLPAEAKKGMEELLAILKEEDAVGNGNPHYDNFRKIIEEKFPESLIEEDEEPTKEELEQLIRGLKPQIKYADTKEEKKELEQISRALSAMLG
jgi:hypothetical protein